MKPVHFKALDGFRGLCALIVVLYHWPVVSHFTGRRFFLPNAQMLMDFFFVMSGFLIAGAYGDKLVAWSDFKRFALRRFCRLWPLHAVTLAALVAVELVKATLAPNAGRLAPFTGLHSWASVCTNLLMIHSLHIHSMLTWNAPSWTVSVEFYTYLMFGALNVVAPRRFGLWAPAMAVIGAAGVALLARQLAATFDWGLFRCFYGFFCGVVVWRLWCVRRPSEPSSRGVATLIEALTLVVVFSFTVLWGGPPGGFAGPLVFALFIWIWASEQGALTAAMSSAPLVKLGQISYSIYLVHFPLIVILGVGLRAVGRLGHFSYAALGVSGVEDMSFVHLPSLWAADLVTAAFLAIVVGVSVWTHKVIEVPGSQLFAAKRRRHSRVFTPAVQA